MSANVRFRPAKQKALALLAAGDLTQEEVAVAVSVAAKTVSRWLREPVFASRLAELVAEIQNAVMTTGIASKRERIAAYDERWRVMREHITDVDGVNTYVARELRELEKQAAIEVGQWEEKHEVSIVPTVREYPAGWGSPAPAIEGAE